MSFPKVVSEIIVKARDRYADCTSTKALDYFNNAWRDLADAANLRYKAQTITLTAGTRDYALPEDVIDVSSVYYQRTSDPTTWYQMWQKDQDELDQLRQGWRTSTTRQEPFEYCITSGVGTTAQLARGIFTLVQLPITTSTAGYPCIGIWGQAITDLLTTDTIPAFLNTDAYFVNSIKRQYAESADTPNIGTWMALEQAALAKLTRHMASIGAHHGTRLIPAWTQRTSSAR